MFDILRLACRDRWEVEDAKNKKKSHKTSPKALSALQIFLPNLRKEQSPTVGGSVGLYLSVSVRDLFCDSAGEDKLQRRGKDHL